MSIYFFHVIQAYFGVVIYLSLLAKRLSIKDFFISSLIGALCGFTCFRIASDFLAIDELKTFVCLSSVAIFVLSPLFLFKTKVVKIALTSLLLFTSSALYRIISLDFTLFNAELLDTVSVISFVYTILGFVFILLIYLFLRNIADGLSKVKIALFCVMSVLLILKNLSEASLELMRFGILPTHESLLSIVSKLIYYGSFLPYLYTMIILSLILSYLFRLPRLRDKKELGDIAYRKTKAVKQKMLNTIKWVVVICIAINAVLIYYDFYASRPPKISTPIILEPINGEFKISMETLKDNDLHRFAYITDEGIKIRFFALNKYPDKISPVIVYDACMICGDMGYVKNGDELICISCNVRIYLPSVGKAGGCNPIPLSYEFDGEYLTVKLKELEKGANYFSEIVEKEVIDPVSQKKIINLKAPHSYLYEGKTYFFENKENYTLFMQDPKRYAFESKEVYWRTQGYMNGKEG